jgi:DNA polymerase elongation subunit (family B)
VSLLDEIEQETKLAIELEELYSWMAFVCSKVNPNLSVANRFFGLQPDREYKIRGLASRWEDTPLFIVEAQLQVLQILSKEKDVNRLGKLFPEILNMLQEKLSALNSPTISVNKLVISQTLSRELEQYRVPSSAARAASQLQAIGKDARMGQRIQFVYTRTKDGVSAWDLPEPIQPSLLDIARYKELLLRAVYEVLQPLGVTENILRNWMFCEASYLVPAGFLHSWLEMPLFANMKYFCVEIF